MITIFRTTFVPSHILTKVTINQIPREYQNGFDRFIVADFIIELVKNDLNTETKSKKNKVKVYANDIQYENI